jgi:GTP cyclohydrolase I
MSELIVTWAEFQERCWQIGRKAKNGTRFYGVPTGGAIVAHTLGEMCGTLPAMSPEEADVIVDDLVDSGRTREKYLGHGKPFMVLFDKQTEPELAGKWLVFPWEKPGGGVAECEDHVTRLIEALGEDITREGLVDTPRRFTRFLRDFLAPDPFEMTTFKNEGIDEMIVQSSIPFFSLCEHHLAPFFGEAAVAYIPGSKIVGLSKLSRTVEMFARRLQNQERITQQVAEFLMGTLEPKGVAVMLRARHLCMEMRGVRTHDVFTTTSCLTGAFKDHPETRAEFLTLAR